MQVGEGWLSEVFYQRSGADGCLRCGAALVPAPGQYVLADVSPEEGRSTSSTASVLFSCGAVEDGFKFAGTLPEAWRPGVRLALRGPLGRGFHVPAEARRVGLLAFDDSPARLGALVPGLLAQGVEVTLVCKPPHPELPEAVEIQPPEALAEVGRWADFLAVDADRTSLPELVRRLGKELRVPTQVLVRAPMPCGALAECGVCAVASRRGWRMACKDGPVFDLKELGEK